MAAVSYFEKPQIAFFTPLRNFLYIPDQAVQVESIPDLPDGMPYKASKEGYYVNPWKASSMVFKTACTVLDSDDGSIRAAERRQLIEFAGYFLNCAEIRQSNGRRFAVWPYPINFTYGVRPGWISGMAQGNIAVLLAAASLCSPEPQAASFEEYARMALTSFETIVEDGGVLVRVDGGNWYEEYAQPGVLPPQVLNGHIYALIAMDRLRKFDDRAEGLVDRGLTAIMENMHHYELLTWSYYDRVGTPANSYYQRLHARQMKTLHEMTGNEFFLSHHRKLFVQCLVPFSSLQRLTLRPSRFLIFLLVVDTIAVWVVSAALGQILKRLRATSNR